MKLMSTGSFHSSDGRKKINTKQVYFGRDMCYGQGAMGQYGRKLLRRKLV